MDVFLMILGIIAAIASLVLSIIAIINGTSKTIPLLLLAIAVSLIKIGRVINHNNRKK